MKEIGEEEKTMLSGELIQCTYEGLPLEYEQFDFVYVEGNIPFGIWDVIRAKHEEYMKGEPGEWQVDVLFDITLETLRSVPGLKVYTFGKGSTFPALSSDQLCGWCHSMMVEGDKRVTSEATGDAVFCSNSCLFDALMQKIDKLVKSMGQPDKDNPLLECPHCHTKSYSVSDKWGSEGPFKIDDELEFSIMTCPHCGEVAPMFEPEKKHD